MKRCTKYRVQLPLRFFLLALGKNRATCDFFPGRHDEEQHLDADAKNARSAGDFVSVLCWQLNGIRSNVCPQFIDHRERGIEELIHVLLHLLKLLQFSTKDPLLCGSSTNMEDGRDRTSKVRDRRIQRSAISDERGQLVADLDRKGVQTILALLCAWDKRLTPTCEESIQGFDVALPSWNLSDVRCAETFQFLQIGWQLRNLLQQYSTNDLPVRLLSVQELIVLLGSDSRGFLRNLSRPLRCAVSENCNHRRCYRRNEPNDHRRPIRDVAPVCCQRTRTHSRSSLISERILP